MIIGSVLGLNGLAMALVQTPAGYLADRLGNRSVMMIAWGTGTFATVIMAFAQSLLGFSIGLIIYGISAMSAATSSYITNVRGKMSVGRALTMVSAMYHLGAFIGPIFGGKIGEQLGLQIIYRFSIFFFLVSSVILLFTRRDKNFHSGQAENHHNPLKFRPFALLLGISFISIFSGYLPEPLTPNFLQEVHNLSLSEIGRLGSIGSLGNAVISLAFGGINPFLGILIGHGFLAAFSMFIWQGTGMVWFAFGFFLRGGYRIYQAMYLSIARDLLTARDMGLAYGMMATGNSLAVILAPPTAGLIYQYNPTLIYPVSLSLIFITLIINLSSSRYLKTIIKTNI